MQNPIKTFTINFFKNLNCEIETKNNLLFIKNIPEDFQKLAGKPEPFILAFNSEDNIDGAELITQGSYLLKTMNKYLESLCQTTLLKIDFNLEPKVEITNKFPLRNCQILNIDKTETPKFFTRFTFMTTFQYLNEREQIMNTIYIKDNQVTDFYLTSYNTSEGNIKEIPSESIKKDYTIAKEKLKSLIEYKTQTVGKELKKCLKKETDRIQKHYQSSVNEIENKSNNPQEKIRELRKEEKFFLNDEMQKHSLNIKNKLMNTTIIYYPIFIYNLTLKNETSQTTTQLTFNPLTREFNPITCNNCNEEINEIILCSSGHITCKNCGDRCNSCNEIYCKKCNLEECSICNIKLCKCQIKCNNCRKIFCKDHTRTINSENLCINCITSCNNCKRELPKYQLKNNLCEKCNINNASKDVLDEVFGNNNWR
ncbi:hypothetical protein HOE04_01945 [archaeon]|jgi:hypothetical protein|nr:hypothetical protein [archaeon]